VALGVAVGMVVEMCAHEKRRLASGARETSDWVGLVRVSVTHGVRNSRYGVSDSADALFMFGCSSGRSSMCLKTSHDSLTNILH
jgi:hypothetical protein